MKIISCDWGTSTLRLRLVDADAINILSEVRSSEGIASVFESWQRSGKGERERESFYRDALSNQIRKLEEQSKTSLDEVPVVISGMASSSIGMTELPYKEVPFNIINPDLNYRMVDAAAGFDHAICLISGVRTDNDVMRGEETQLIGCIDDVVINGQLFIFPGTHSKHVFVENNSVVDFKTYMTGEFFDLLSTKSVLSSSVVRPGALTPELKKSFREGVMASGQGSLLHHSFLVRTNDLFKKYSKEENYCYLSGLLIGNEINELSDNDKQITLVADGEIGELYTIALKNILTKITFHLSDPGIAFVRGQVKIFKKIISSFI